MTFSLAINGGDGKATEMEKWWTMFYDFFTKRSKSRLGAWNLRLYFAKLLQILQQAGAVQGEVLEIGPGEGSFAYQCKDAGLKYKGLERSPGLQRRLVEEGFEVILGTAPPLPFEGERFDLVCAIAVLEHMPTFEQALTLLQECNRVLKATGMLALLVPDYRRCGIDFYNWDYTHSFVTTPYRMQMILNDTGFQADRIVHFTGALTGPIRWPVDLVSFLVHSRLLYWLGASLGLESWLFKFHKTFEPLFLVISRKANDKLDVRLNFTNKVRFDNLTDYGKHQRAQCTNRTGR
jgi:SAM-dependent methyltransferase